MIMIMLAPSSDPVPASERFAMSNDAHPDDGWRDWKDGDGDGDGLSTLDPSVM